MILKGLIDEDFANYKVPSMFLAFPSCTWKCEKECGVKCCQNSELAREPDIEVDDNFIIERYINNPISKAIVCGGLEPLDSWLFLKEFLRKLRTKTDDIVVIYTGYKEEEIKEIIDDLRLIGNIVLKVGRYRQNDTSHYDKVLGVELASNNQYAFVIK